MRVIVEVTWKTNLTWEPTDLSRVTLVVNHHGGLAAVAVFHATATSSFSRVVSSRLDVASGGMCCSASLFLVIFGGKMRGVSVIVFTLGPGWSSTLLSPLCELCAAVNGRSVGRSLEPTD